MSNSTSVGEVRSKVLELISDSGENNLRVLDIVLLIILARTIANDMRPAASSVCFGGW